MDIERRNHHVFDFIGQTVARAKKEIADALRGHSLEEEVWVRKVLQNPTKITAEDEKRYRKRRAKLVAFTSGDLIPALETAFFRPISHMERIALQQQEEGRFNGLTEKERYGEIVKYALRKAEEWNLH